MIHRIATIVAIVAVILSLSFSAHAQQAMDNMPCPMMENMGEMKSDMQSMMQMMSDPAMKERMQKMHDKMGSMMQQMADTHKDMHGMMMDCGAMGGNKSSDKPAEVSPEDHETHHPD